jgi:hypothetical protein
VHVGPPLVANRQPAVLRQLRKRSLPHWCRPTLSLGSTSRRAMRGVMPLFLSALRQRGKSLPLSACSVLGRFFGLPGRPRGRLIGSMPSTASSKTSSHGRLPDYVSCGLLTTQ